jgi:hypothetical protein
VRGAAPQLLTDQPAVAPGEVLRIDGRSFRGETIVQLRWNGDAAVTATASPQGTFTVVITVPADEEEGMVTVEAVKAAEADTADPHVLASLDVRVERSSVGHDFMSWSIVSTAFENLDPMAEAADRETRDSPDAASTDDEGVATTGGDEPAAPMAPSATSTVAPAATAQPASVATPAPTSQPTAVATPAPTPAVVTPAPTSQPAPTAAPATPAPAAASGAMLIDRATLLALPTSGSAWSTLKSVADGSLGTANLRDQNNTHSARTLAAALVGVRLNSASHLDKARAGLRAAQGTEATGSSNMVLAAGRQLVGYIIAADLIGYRDPGFVSWVSGMRTKELGGHGRWTRLAQTHADTANNWGAWAGASRVAAAIYVGDRADTATAAAILRGWLGDRGAYAGFRTTADFDAAWACNAGSWTAINPACSTAKDGAVVEEASRSSGSYPNLDATAIMYSWEALGGAQLQALLLQRAGYGDVWEWSNRGFLRAARWLERNGGYAPPYAVNQYMPWIFDWAYATSVGRKNAAGMGRTFGFTDWLYGGR